MINACLIGLGNIAWKYDARNPQSSAPLTQAGAMLEHPRLRLAGGCSPEPEDRRAFADWLPGARVYSSCAEMLATERPTLVGICSPTEEHFAQARQCMEAGVRMLWLEKPPADNPEQLLALRDLARRRNVKVCVNYIRRYAGAYRRMKGLLQSGAYGELQLLRLLYSPGLLRNGVHLVDLSFFLTDADAYELLWVDAAGGASPSFALRLSTGVLVQACGADLPYHTNDLNAVCSGGALSLLRGGGKAVVESRVEDARYPGFYELDERDSGLLGTLDGDPYMRAALSDLLASLTEDREPLSNPATALLTQALLEEILGRAGRAAPDNDCDSEAAGREGKS